MVMKLTSKTIWILIFAIAMGFLESSVVVYLRALYYPEGFDFPMREMAPYLALTELYREAATIIMIMAVSILSAERGLQRFAWFLVIFSTWDISYYVFLKVLVDWPSSMLTTDILFLLPSIWTGPVIAPVINSITMLLLAFAILNSRKGYEPVIRLAKSVWVLLIAGSLIVLIAYMKDFAAFAIEQRHLYPEGSYSDKQYMMFLSTQFIPRYFDWLLFVTGVCMHLLAVFITFVSRFKNRVPNG